MDRDSQIFLKRLDAFLQILGFQFSDLSRMFLQLSLLRFLDFLAIVYSVGNGFWGHPEIMGGSPVEGNSGIWKGLILMICAMKSLILCAISAILMCEAQAGDLVGRYQLVPATVELTRGSQTGGYQSSEVKELFRIDTVTGRVWLHVNYPDKDGKPVEEFQEISETTLKTATPSSR